MSEIAIRVENLSKQYRIGGPSTGLRTGPQACYKTIRESLSELPPPPPGKTGWPWTEESHTMRYFFPRELEFLLECSGFALMRLGAFPEFDQDPDETTWNVLGVTRAV